MNKPYRWIGWRQLEPNKAPIKPRKHLIAPILRQIFICSLSSWLTCQGAFAASFHPLQEWVRGHETVPIAKMQRGTANWGLEAASLAYGIVLDKEEYALGEPIVLHLIAKNQADTKAFIQFAMVGPQRKDLVINLQAGVRNGADPKWKIDVDSLPKGAWINSRNIECQPGFAEVESIRIDQLFDLVPGSSYLVFATRQVSERVTGTKSEITSGNAVFRITAAGPDRGRTVEGDVPPTSANASGKQLVTSNPPGPRGSFQAMNQQSDTASHQILAPFRGQAHQAATVAQPDAANASNGRAKNEEPGTASGETNSAGRFFGGALIAMSLGTIIYIFMRHNGK